MLNSDSKIDVDSLPASLAVPSVSSTKTILESPTYDLSDLWQYRSCGLMDMVGERNSSLGKVMTASQQLIYETRLLATLNRCLSAELAQEQINWLTSVAEMKQKQLAARWNNLMWSEPTLRKLQSVPAQRTLPRPFRQQTAITLAALASLKLETLNQSAVLDQSFEQMLSEVRGSQYLGQLTQDGRIALHIINETNALLDRVLPQVTCIDNKASSQAKQLKGYLLGYYGSEVQPSVSNLMRELEAVSPAINQLFPSPPKGSAIGLLKSGEASLRAELLSAIAEHRLHWQTMFDRCGLSLQS
ncbi:DUF3080 family protein [Corallincola platygyrae]|uniref:DUF3080 family protein n=1 Tax=Corallincola platygyrae TaxID=1193278 RepID=A0ABW4XKW3_9GAMM